MNWIGETNLKIWQFEKEKIVHKSMLTITRCPFDSTLSNVETTLLKQQIARIGRAEDKMHIDDTFIMYLVKVFGTKWFKWFKWNCQGKKLTCIEHLWGVKLKVLGTSSNWWKITTLFSDPPLMDIKLIQKICLSLDGKDLAEKLLNNCWKNCKKKQKTVVN